MHKTFFHSSGLTVVTQRISRAKSVHLGLWIPAGSAYESPEDNGISHFVEHMVFKGTGLRSARQIAEAADSVGGVLDAFTAKDCTCIYANVTTEHLPLALDLLTDMAFHPALDETELEREKSVVLEEIAMVEDTPEDLVHELLGKAAFGEHPLGQAILGPAENIRAMTSGRLRSFMAKVYRPERMVLSVVGGFDPEMLDELLSRALPEASDPLPAREILPCQPVWQSLSRQKPIEQTHLAMALPGVSRRDKGYASMLALNAMLGGGMSSRLFQSVREQRGLAYSVYSFTSIYPNSAALCIYAGLSPQNLTQTREIIASELESLHRGDFSDEELARAKDQIRGGFILGQEAPGNRMMSLGKGTLLYGGCRSEAHILRSLEQINRESVAAVAQRILSGPQSIAILSPDK